MNGFIVLNNTLEDIFNSIEKILFKHKRYYPRGLYDNSHRYSISFDPTSKYTVEPSGAVIDLQKHRQAFKLKPGEYILKNGSTVVYDKPNTIISTIPNHPIYAPELLKRIVSLYTFNYSTLKDLIIKNPLDAKSMPLIDYDIVNKEVVYEEDILFKDFPTITVNEINQILNVLAPYLEQIMVFIESNTESLYTLNTDIPYITKLYRLGSIQEIRFNEMLMDHNSKYQ